MKRIGVTDDAISIFQVAFLDEMRCWNITQPIVGMQRWYATRRPPANYDPKKAQDPVEPVIEKATFDNKATAQFFVQQACIRAGLVTLMGQENVMELLPIIDVPVESA